MDGHNFHRTLTCAGKIHLPVIDLIFLQMLNISYEVKKPPVTCFLIIHGLFHQHGKIGTSLGTVWKGFRIIAVAGSPKNFKDQLMDRRVNCKVAHFCKQTNKTMQFLIKHRIPVICPVLILFQKFQHTLVDHPIRMLFPEHSQLL